MPGKEDGSIRVPQVRHLMLNIWPKATRQAVRKSREETLHLVTDTRDTMHEVAFPPAVRRIRSCTEEGEQG